MYFYTVPTRPRWTLDILYCIMLDLNSIPRVKVTLFFAFSSGFTFSSTDSLQNNISVSMCYKRNLYNSTNQTLFCCLSHRLKLHWLINPVCHCFPYNFLDRRQVHFMFILVANAVITFFGMVLPFVN